MGFERELGLLDAGAIEIVGRVVESSNLTFVAGVTVGDEYAWAIYKPQAGERPLWDFEPGLYRRERAAFLLSEHLGWRLVPPTVVRDDGPLGVGSLQWYVDPDPREHYFTLVEEAPEAHPDLRRIAVFDLVANNTDRKSGHVLRDRDGRVWGIDHGLCFADEFKLRTVIWDFAGDPIDEALLDAVAPLADAVPDEVADLLSASEVRSLRERVQTVLRRPVLPFDRTGRRFPWPLV